LLSKPPKYLGKAGPMTTPSAAWLAALETVPSETFVHLLAIEAA